MDRSWQIEEAQAQLEEVVRRALTGEPQIITGSNGEQVIVLPKRPSHGEEPPPTGIAFLLAGGPLSPDDNELDEAIRELRESGVGIMGGLPR